MGEYFIRVDRFNGDVAKYGNMFELVHRSSARPRTRNPILATQPSALPRLITHRPALILYGRPCDHSTALFTKRHFYKVRACFPFALFFVFGLGGPHPGSSHRRLVPSSAPIDCLATTRRQEPPGTQ